MAGEFNVNAGDYNNAVATISEAEGAVTGERAAEVSIDAALENRLEMQELPYSRAADIINLAEGGYAYTPSTQAVRPTAPKAAVAPRRAPAPVSPETVEAAREIKSLVGSAGREYEQKVSREAEKVRKGELVLPSLSIQDQISELEKISMGIDEKVFNSDMRKIIIDEVSGLNGKVKGEKLENRDVFQRNIIAVRNQRLDEAMTKLGVK